jgi:hypothetical protein
LSAESQRAAEQLGRAISDRAQRAASEVAVTMQLATVTAIGPIEILLDTAQTAQPASYLTSYTPAVNDRVLVLVYLNTFMVLGTATT